MNRGTQPSSVEWKGITQDYPVHQQYWLVFVQNLNCKLLSSAFTSNPVWLMIFKIDKKCTIFWTGGTMPQNPNATWCNDLHVVDGVRLLDILYLDHPVEEWWCRRKWEHYWRDFYQRLILLRFNLNTIRMSAAWGGSTCCKCH